MKDLKSYSTDSMGWEAWRSDKFGSSDIGAILGLNRYKSPLSLYFEKVDGKLDRKDSVMMRIGSAMEPQILSIFSDKLKPGETIEYPRKTFVDAKNERFIASPDAILHTPDGAELLECKFSSSYSTWSDGIPDSYHCQVTWLMGILGLQKARILLLLTNAIEVREFPIEFNQELFDQIYNLVEKFQKMVDTKTPPNPIETDKNLVSSLYEINDDELQIKDDISLFWLGQYQSASAELKKMNAEVKKISAKQTEAFTNLLNLSKGHTLVTLPEGKKLKWTKVNVNERTNKGYSFWRMKAL